MAAVLIVALSVSGAAFCADEVEVDLQVETRGAEHSDEVVASLEAAAFTVHCS